MSQNFDATGREFFGAKALRRPEMFVKMFVEIA
jgi:hypothetical protein